MSTTAVEATRTNRRAALRIAVGVALVVALTAVAAFQFGQRRPDVHTKTLACMSAEAFISCGYPDSPGRHFVVVPRDVPWTDAQGMKHRNGRPGCLPPTGIGTTAARVSWVEFRLNGVANPVAVSVECLR